MDVRPASVARTSLKASKVSPSRRSFSRHSKEPLIGSDEELEAPYGGAVALAIAARATDSLPLLSILN